VNLTKRNKNIAVNKMFPEELMKSHPDFYLLREAIIEENDSEINEILIRLLNIAELKNLKTLKSLVEMFRKMFTKWE